MDTSRVVASEGLRIGFVVTISALLAYALVTLNYFAYAGFGLLGMVLSSWSYFSKGRRDILSTVFYGLAMLFSLLLVVKANPTLTVFNFMAAIYSGSLLLLYKVGWDFSIARVWSAPLRAFFGVAHSPANFKTGRLLDSFLAYVQPVAISLLVVLVLIPLLSSANPFFNDLANSYIYDPIGDLFENFTESVLVNMVRVLVFFTLVWFLPKISAFESQDKETTDLVLKDNFLGFNLGSLTIPKGFVAVLLTIFFVTQLQLYFATPETLVELGYSNSEYAREVFGQLLIVGMIVFGLVYLDSVEKKINRVLSYVLLAQIGFLGLMALKSVYDYHQEYGLTFRRLYGYTAVVWLSGVLGFFVHHFVLGTKRSRFILHALLYSGLVWLGVNLVNFDKLIFARSPIMYEERDWNYLSILSSDSQSWDEQYTHLASVDTDELNQAKYNLYRKMSYLQRKYGQDSDWRTFNLSEYWQYQQIEDLDVIKINEGWEGTYILRDRGQNSTKDAVQQVLVTIQNLDQMYFDQEYQITFSSNSGWEQNIKQLEGNVFVHDRGVGRYKVQVLKRSAIEGEGTIYTRTQTDSFTYEITASDLEQGSKVLEYVLE